MVKGNTVSVNLKADISYDSLNTDIQPFDDSARMVDNLTINRNGGAGNLNVTEETNTIVGNYFYTDGGDKLALDSAGVVYCNDSPIGTVSPYGVEKRNTVSGADDVILTATGYVTASLVGTSMILKNFDDNWVELATRTTVFPNISTIVPFITSVNIVRTKTPAFTDNFEFVVRIGDQISFLSEASPNASVLKYLQSTTVVGSNAITALCVFNGVMYVAGGNRIGSYDGTAWRNYDGSGAGAGSYTTTVLGSNTINTMLVYRTQLIVAGQGGRVGSYDGTAWKNYDGSGTGSGYNSTTINSTNDIFAGAVWNNILALGGAAGTIGAYDGTTTYVPSSTALVNGIYAAPNNNGTAIGANAVRTMYIMTAGIEAGFQSVLVVGGDGGGVASFDGSWINSAGTASLSIATAVATNTAATGLSGASSGGSVVQSIYCDNGFFYALTSSTIQRSVDGINWTGCSLPVGVNNLVSIAYGGGVWLAVVSNGVTASTTFIRSTDGINFAFITTAPTVPNIILWKFVSYGNGVFIATFSNLSNNTTNIQRSLDGLTWSSGTTPNISSTSFPCYANGFWVCSTKISLANQEVIRSSDNGATWSFATSPGAIRGNVASIAYQNGVFVLMGGVSTTSSMRSTDNGATWANVTLPTAPGGGGFYYVASTDGMFYATTDSGTTINSLYTSPDGATWTAQTTPAGFAGIGGAVFGIGKFLTIKTTGATPVIYSTKAINFTRISGESSTFNGGNSIKAGTLDGSSSYYYMGASNGGIGSVSTNGFLSSTGKNGFPFQRFTNTNIATPAGALVKIAYSGSRYVAVFSSTSTSASVATSTDGRTWTFVTSPAVAGAWTDIAYGNGTFMLIGATTSTTAGVYTFDGVTTFSAKTTTAPAGNWKAIAYGNGTFTLIASTASTTAGIAYTTNNGTLFTFATTTAPGGSWVALTYALSNFIAVASTTSTTAGIAYSSVNGTWAFATTTAPAAAWVGVTGGPALAVAVAGTASTTAGIAYSSTPATWAFATTTAPGGAWNSVAYNNGMFVAGGTTATTTSAMAYSYNGSTWTFKTLPYLQANMTKVLATDTLLVYSLGLTRNTEAMYYTKTHAKPFAYNAGGAVNSQAITAMAYFNNQVVVGAGAGLVASFDGTNWKNYDGTGTGTGPYINGTPALAIGAMAVTPSNYLLIGYAGGLANGMDTSWVYSPTNNSTAGGADSNNSVYAYKYENGYYLWHVVNAKNNVIYLASSTTVFPTTILGKYAYPEIKSNLTRHIVTESPRGDSSNLYAFSVVGYTDFVSFTATQVYPTTGQNISGSGEILQGAIGWNYADVSFKNSTSAVNIFNYYGPQPVNAQTELYQISQGNTNNLLTGYGKLSNTIEVTSPVEFRINWLVVGDNSYQSYISAAVNDGGGTDNLGVLLTGVGEFDDTYTPIVYTNRLLYRYKGSYYTVKVSTSPEMPIQRIDDRLYKINTLSPLNLYNATLKTLNVSSADYHGQVKWNFTGTPATVSNSFVALFQSDFSNSVDNGAKINTVDSVLAGNFIPFGIRVPYSTIIDFTVDEFVDNNYIGSYDNSGYNFVAVNPFTVIYSPVETIPYPIGQRINFGALVSNNDSTLVLSRSYDGYIIGNGIPGTFQASFILFGQTYLYDGLSIYLTTIINGIVTAYDKISDAFGLSFIAQTPEVIYFLSSFDNSLYTFNGGKSVSKAMTLVSMDTISTGVFNAKENTLMLDATNHLITLRDGQLTQILKTAEQANGVVLYSTTSGIIIANDQKSWQYTYNQTENSTPVPFLIQTGYYGLRYNEKCILDEMVLTIYDISKGNKTLTCTVNSYDESKSYADKVTFKIGASDYTHLGLAKVRIQPKRMKALGISLKVESVQSVFITDIELNYNDGEQSGIRNSR